jgi:hypothetical protein
MEPPYLPNYPGHRHVNRMLPSPASFSGEPVGDQSTFLYAQPPRQDSAPLWHAAMRFVRNCGCQ